MATIYEISEASGVSPKTVARILAGESKRSKNRDKVLKCARDLGYVRNANAANLRTGKTSLVGVLVPFIDNPYYTQFAQELHNALAKHHLQPLIACSFGRTMEFNSALKAFRSYNVDAILINSSQGSLSEETSELLNYFQSVKKPLMLIGRSSENPTIDQADIDNSNGIEKIVDYLVAKGHTRIAFIGGRASSLTPSARLRGYRLGMEKAGLPISDKLISLGEGSPQDAAQRVQQLLAETSPRPTALVCNNDMMAIAAIKTCRRAGLRVPEDIAVTGFDDIEFASMMEPALTTLHQPISQIASDCVKRLVERLHAEEPPVPRQFLYETELVVRDSA